jgi:hypothetical protein
MDPSSFILGLAFLILSPVYIVRGLVLGIWGFITGSESHKDEFEKFIHGIFFSFFSLVAIIPIIAIVGLLVVVVLVIRAFI